MLLAASARGGGDKWWRRCWVKLSACAVLRLPHQPCLEGHKLQAPRAAIASRQSALPGAGVVGRWAEAVLDQCRRSHGEAGHWVP